MSACGLVPSPLNDDNPGLGHVSALLLVLVLSESPLFFVISCEVGLVTSLGFHTILFCSWLLPQDQLQVSGLCLSADRIMELWDISDSSKDGSDPSAVAVDSSGDGLQVPACKRARRDVQAAASSTTPVTGACLSATSWVQRVQRVLPIESLLQAVEEASALADSMQWHQCHQHRVAGSLGCSVCVTELCEKSQPRQKAGPPVKRRTTQNQHPMTLVPPASRHARKPRIFFWGKASPSPRLGSLALRNLHGPHATEAST